MKLILSSIVFFASIFSLANGLKSNIENSLKCSIGNGKYTIYLTAIKNSEKVSIRMVDQYQRQLINSLISDIRVEGRKTIYSHYPTNYKIEVFGLGDVATKYNGVFDSQDPDVGGVKSRVNMLCKKI